MQAVLCRTYGALLYLHISTQGFRAWAKLFRSSGAASTVTICIRAIRRHILFPGCHGLPTFLCVPSCPLWFKVFSIFLCVSVVNGFKMSRFPDPGIGWQVPVEPFNMSCG